MNNTRLNGNKMGLLQKYSFSLTCFVFSVIYPTALILVGYFILKSQLDLGVYANIIAISFAILVSERLYVKINNSALSSRIIIKFTVFFSIYNFIVQIASVALVDGVEKALTGDAKFLAFISIGYVFIIYFALLILSKLKNKDSDAEV